MSAADARTRADAGLPGWCRDVDVETSVLGDSRFLLTLKPKRGKMLAAVDVGGLLRMVDDFLSAVSRPLGARSNALIEAVEGHRDGRVSFRLVVSKLDASSLLVQSAEHRAKIVRDALARQDEAPDADGAEPTAESPELSEPPAAEAGSPAADEAGAEAAGGPAIKGAGIRLSEALFGGGHGVGNVGVGTDRLYVMVYGQWHGDRCESFEGFPVEWRDGLGLPEASGT